MTWKLELEGHSSHPEHERLVLTVIRNLIEDLKSGQVTEAHGVLETASFGTHRFDISPTIAPPPHLGGPDVPRDAVTGLPLEEPAET
jgi:hypothetical protein